MTPMFARSSGLLLHVTSLPGGKLGPAADRFVQFCEQSGQRWWQLLPVHPPGYGESPYAALSAFAGNEALLPAPRAPHPTWTKRPRWLRDYTLYRALKDHYGQRPWWQWPRAVRDRDPAALRRARDRHADRIRHYDREQCRFDREWSALKRRANDAGVSLMGDIPLFVARDSADVWTHRSLFRFDVVAGVPPDYFAADGQLWGNPHYDWAAHRRSRFAWWVSRFARAFELFDAVRIDHFLGLHRVWQVPRRAKTARNGTWEIVPGDALLHAVRRKLGPRKLVAENLGILTPEAETLRERHGIPGMRVLHFSFGDDLAARPFWSTPDTVVYTGTHDNDTTRGWLASANGDGTRALRYLGCEPRELPHAMMRLAWQSASNLAIAPVQDVLALGSRARMNVPGTTEGNWSWRLRRGQLDANCARFLKSLTEDAAR